MRCKKVQKLMVAYLDNELSCRKQDVLKSHLAACVLCSAELDKYKKLNGIIEQFPKLEDRSPLFWQKQISDIERKVAKVNSGKTPEPTISKSWIIPVWQKVAVASATITIAAVVLLLNFPQHQIQPIISSEKTKQPVPVLDKQLAASKITPIEKRRELGIVEQPKREIQVTEEIKQVERIPAVVPPSGSVASVSEKQNVRKEEKGMIPSSKSATERERFAGVAGTPALESLSGGEPSGGEPVKLGRTVAESSPKLPTETFGTIFRDTESDTSGVGRTILADNIFYADSTQMKMKGFAGGAPPLTFVSQQTSNRNYFGFGNFQQTTANLSSMELQVQTNSPDQQNQRVIEIRDIPQSGNSAPRHLQIKMEFQP